MIRLSGATLSQLRHPKKAGITLQKTPKGRHRMGYPPPHLDHGPTPRPAPDAPSITEPSPWPAAPTNRLAEKGWDHPAKNTKGPTPNGLPTTPPRPRANPATSPPRRRCRWGYRRRPRQRPPAPPCPPCRQRHQSRWCRRHRSYRPARRPRRRHRPTAPPMPVGLSAPAPPAPPGAALSAVPPAPPEPPVGGVAGLRRDAAGAIRGRVADSAGGGATGAGVTSNMDTLIALGRQCSSVLTRGRGGWPSPRRCRCNSWPGGRFCGGRCNRRGRPAAPPAPAFPPFPPVPPFPPLFPLPPASPPAPPLPPSPPVPLRRRYRRCCPRHHRHRRFRPFRQSHRFRRYFRYHRRLRQRRRQTSYDATLLHWPATAPANIRLHGRRTPTFSPSAARNSRTPR